MKWATFFVAMLTVSSLEACINDRDTLAFEMRNVDALKRVTQETDRRKRAGAIQEIALKAIGGRFERFPPQYYEMRIKRLESLSKPYTPAEADDVAVAYDRLGKVDTAIEILLNNRWARRTDDEKYRFHANYGTFLVHRWIVNGHTDKDIATLEESISEIEAALKINPDSHFGRESVQLKLEQAWLKKMPVAKKLRELKPGDAIVGLSGIAMMGLGYELPDIYAPIAESSTAMTYGGAAKTNLSAFAGFRMMELEAAGVKPVGVITPYESPGGVSKQYLKLRKDGDEVHKLRLAYMQKRFDRGEHPDTNPDFWSEWQEPPVPVLVIVPDPHSPESAVRSLVYMIVKVVLALAAIGGTILLIARARRA